MLQVLPTRLVYLAYGSFSFTVFYPKVRRGFGLLVVGGLCTCRYCSSSFAVGHGSLLCRVSWDPNTEWKVFFFHKTLVTGWFEHVCPTVESFSLPNLFCFWIPLECLFSGHPQAIFALKLCGSLGYFEGLGRFATSWVTCVWTSSLHRRERFLSGLRLRRPAVLCGWFWFWFGFGFGLGLGLGLVRLVGWLVGCLLGTLFCRSTYIPKFKNSRLAWRRLMSF